MKCETPSKEGGCHNNLAPTIDQTSAAPLHELTIKSASNRVKWTEQTQLAFNALKKALCSETVLHTPNFGKRFLLQTGASEDFKFTVEHRAGRLHGNTDAMSRRDDCLLSAAPHHGSELMGAVSLIVPHRWIESTRQSGAFLNLNQRIRRPDCLGLLRENQTLSKPVSGKSPTDPQMPTAAKSGCTGSSGPL
ncbi:unnamed protein product [Pleuronectes platessa]|uniref:Reverse transcriptase/retrotransposon-derived protein RNase H-like domain-containing protein n=1 Tax=Pleuronectes platessa TaxID=8262 RepID=A0A9N7YSE2_PLEPL|nr:unnamed protein product [Pleuronectes platessa]